MKNVTDIISDSDRRGDTIRSRYIIYFEKARDDAKKQRYRCCDDINESVG